MFWDIYNTGIWILFETPRHGAGPLGHCPVSLECVILSSIQKGHRRKSGCSIALASFSYVFQPPVRIVFLQTHVYILLFPRTVSESNREHVVRSDPIAAMILFLSSGCQEMGRIPGERSRRSSRFSLTLPSCEQPASSFFCNGWMISFLWSVFLRTACNS